MIKIKVLVLVVIAVSMVFIGCDIPDSAQTESVPAAPTAYWEPVTDLYEQPNDWGLAFGDEVWAVESDSDDAYMIRYAFIAQRGDFIEVVPYFTSDVVQLRESMGETYLIDAKQVYFNRLGVMVAVAGANGETFEEYRGEEPCT